MTTADGSGALPADPSAPAEAGERAAQDRRVSRHDSPGPEPDRDPHRWRMLTLLAAGQLLGMSAWFTASAVAPQLQALWALDAARAGWLTMAVQIGFVAGTACAAVLNLADILPARRYFAASALLAAAANSSLLIAPGFETGLAGRFLTGFFLAGVYPPAMKMIATWFRAMRGLAIGTLVGALTVGKALPYLVSAVEMADLSVVVLFASGAAVAAAALVGLGYRDGPFPFDRRPFSWGLVGVVVRHRETRLATAGYLGHMWELYAAWAFIGVFFYDYFLLRGTAEPRAAAAAGLAAFSMIAAGGLGAVLAGRWADRFGRERIASLSLVVSGGCALLMGWLLAAPPVVTIAVAVIWGFAVVADSAQFSALVTEVSPRHAVGTALTFQVMLGFLLTSVTIAAVPVVRAQLGWPVAFSMLALGPAFGIVAMHRLRRVRRR